MWCHKRRENPKGNGDVAVEGTPRGSPLHVTVGASPWRRGSELRCSAPWETGREGRSGAHRGRGRNSAGVFSNRRNGSTERELSGGLLRPPRFTEEDTEAQSETDDFAQGHTANYPGLEPEPPAAQDSPLHCGECPTPGAREPRRLPGDALSQRGHGGVCNPTAEGRTG